MKRNTKPGSKTESMPPAGPGSPRKKRVTAPLATADESRRDAVKAATRAPKKAVAAPPLATETKPPAGPGPARKRRVTAPLATAERSSPEAVKAATRAPKKAVAVQPRAWPLQVVVLPRPDGKPLPPPKAPLAAATGVSPGALAGDPSVMRRVAEAQRARGTLCWGIAEPDFTVRTGLTGKAIQHAIEAAPGHDVYYVNPSPHIEALFINGWHQGYTAHPKFAEAAGAVLRAAGVDVAELDRLEPSERFVSGHCIYGNDRFWTAYLDFLDTVLHQARARLDAEQIQWLDSHAADPRKLHRGANYWHFIVERLLPIFLRGPGKALRAHRFDVPERTAKLNGHQRRLREMKDVAHRTKSAWMYSCWLHYRNLYLLQVTGKQWCETYLPAISKTDVLFD